MAKSLLLGVWDLTKPVTEGKRTALGMDSGAIAITLEFNFIYGSGGSTCNAKVQCSFDGGETWRDVARADFTTASRVAHCNLEGMLSKAIGAYAPLNAEGVNDGIISNLLRVITTSATAYSNTTLSVRAAIRSPSAG